MHVRFGFVTLAILLWMTSAHAQIRPYERPHEHFRERPHSIPPMAILPPRHEVEVRRLAGPVRGGDGPLCDNPDNDPDAAIAACGRIIGRGPIKGGYSLVVAFTNRGHAYENKADHDHAIADFSEAILLKPGVSGYFAMRGAAAEQSGKVEMAQADFHQAINLDPTNQDARNGLKRLETRSVASGGGNPAPAPSTPGAVTTTSVTVATATPAVPPPVTPPVSTLPPTPSAATSPRTSVATNSLTAPEAPTETSATKPPATHGPRVALVIGNGNYVNANVLPNPPNDAHAMAGVLREIGFDVQEGENLDRASMENELREFLHKASTASIVLLFYAGHGMQVDGKNYLVPVDAKLAEPSDLAFETIEIDKVLDSLGDPGHTNIILLDACRDNPLARSFARRLPASRSAAVATGLAPYSAVGTGTLIAYATAPGQTALDGAGADSPFTTSLMRNIKIPGLEIRQVLTRVRADVAAETANKQIPWDNSSLMGDVVLVK